MRIRLKLLLMMPLLFSALTACDLFEQFTGGGGEQEEDTQRAGNSVLFVGVDISGSFKKSGHFDDSLRFMSHYLYTHLNGLGDTRIPGDLFVGSIGGAKPNEPKTFYPIQTFQYKDVKGIEKELRKIFSKTNTNRYTDYNAFFKQITTFMRNKKLVMKPTNIVLLTDGIPDAPKVDGKRDYRSLNLKPLENLSRKITVRVLYTSATTGMNWQTKVPRKRVRVWTQDANVMKSWNAKDIMVPGKKFEEQTRFFDWLRDNVDFPVRVRRIR